MKVGVMLPSWGTMLHGQCTDSSLSGPLSSLMRILYSTLALAVKMCVMQNTASPRLRRRFLIPLLVGRKWNSSFVIERERDLVPLL